MKLANNKGFGILNTSGGRHELAANTFMEPVRYLFLQR